MTTDPALRALLAAQIDHLLPGEPFTDTCILARDVFRILAAAEAAPTPETWAQRHGWPEGSIRDEWNEPDAAAEAAPLDVREVDITATPGVDHVQD